MEKLERLDACIGGIEEASPLYTVHGQTASNPLLESNVPHRGIFLRWDSTSANDREIDPQLMQRTGSYSRVSDKLCQKLAFSNCLFAGTTAAA